MGGARRDIARTKDGKFAQMYNRGVNAPTVGVSATVVPADVSTAGDSAAASGRVGQSGAGDMVSFGSPQEKPLMMQVADDLGVPEEAVYKYLDRAAEIPGSFTPTTPPDSRFVYTPEMLNRPDTANYRAAATLVGYKHYLAQPKPVFVYGTLRSGQQRSSILPSERSAASCAGVAMYGAKAPFPCIIESEKPADVAYGEVIWPPAEQDDVLELYDALDHVEGFRHTHPKRGLYERVERDILVTRDDGRTEMVRAWVYVARAGAAHMIDPDDRVHGGDWLAAREEF